MNNKFPKIHAKEKYNVEQIIQNTLKKQEEFEHKNAVVNFDKDKYIAQFDNAKEGFFKNIPIGAKDIISIEGYKVTLGSRLFSDNITMEDAEVIKNLKKQGAVIFSTLTMHELAYGVTGDRSAYGPTLNYNDDNLMSGGSSSGSAVAVALGVVPMAIGTDTSGSIRIPAAYNDIVGFKPAHGDLSTSGVYPLSESLDHVGPMTKNVTDCYISYKVMKDENFNLNNIEKQAAPEKILIPDLTDDYEFETGIMENLIKAGKILKSSGYETETIQLTDIEELMDRQKIILKYESYNLYKDQLSNKDDFDDEVYERILAGENIDKEAYENALKDRNKYIKKYNSIIGANILLLPTTLIYPKKLQQRKINMGRETYIRDRIFNLTGPFNYLGLPALAMPSNLHEEEHYNSVQFVSIQGKEDSLFRVALDFENSI